MLARYVERLLSFETGLYGETSADGTVGNRGLLAGDSGAERDSGGGLTEEFLKRYGF